MSDPIECLGIAYDEKAAHTMAGGFDAERLWMAGGKIQNTIERALIRMLSFKGSIKGWIVLIEKRDMSDVGHEWPVRS